jgi:hypothetical protein
VYGAGCALVVSASSCGEVIQLGLGPTAVDGATPPVSSEGGGADGGACPRGQVNASEVVWAGDSWVQIPGTQHTRVRDLAREAGAIGPTDDYVDVAANGAFMSAIANQYSTQESDPTKAKVKVLIMDGGGFDLILGNGSTATVQGVVNAFTQLLATVASDGTVTQIIYFLVPSELPATPGVASLRQGLVPACAHSAVPCHFLDLEPIWTGHPEYTASGGVLASDAGAAAIADAIWALMQQNCIAQ